MNGCNPPYTILAEIPGESAYIVGAQDGTIGYATAELFADGPEGLKGPDAIHITPGLASVKIPLPSDVAIASFRHDASRPAFDYEDIEIRRAFLENKWTIRLGYGPKSHKWLVQGELQPIE